MNQLIVILIEVVLDKSTQLTLPISLPDDETFASFFVGENEALVSAIKNGLSQKKSNFIYFWSPANAGRSHLLYAACSELAKKEQSVAYFPLEQHAGFSPEMLDGMEHLSLICFDNINAIAGNKVWELAIFNLYNRILELDQCRVLITADCAPRQLALSLPDLTSRLEWGQTYRLMPLSDQDKLQALQLRAKLRGFDLPDDVGRFLLKRLNRDMRTLFVTLDRLDKASIAAQRKLTIPFVKTSLSL